MQKRSGVQELWSDIQKNKQTDKRDFYFINIDLPVNIIMIINGFYDYTNMNCKASLVQIIYLCPQNWMQITNACNYNMWGGENI